jgi:transcriptional regulator with XRE-family HTH domain
MYRKGVTQVEAAQRLDVPKQAFNDWLHGKRTPSSKQAPKLARWLGITTDQLLALVARQRTPAQLARQLAVTEAELADVKADLRKLASEFRKFRRDLEAPERP